MSAPLASGLAELLDSRADTRDMLSTSPNLAHACLLLGRGELDLARRELVLGMKEGNDSAQVIGACIEAELLRLSGDPDAAWNAAVACASRNRLHSVAALYLRFLFPLSRARSASQALEHPAAPAQPAPEAIEPAPAATEEAPPEEIPAPPAPAEPSGFPEGWERVLQEGCLTALRLESDGSVAIHGADLGGLTPLLSWLENDLFPRTQMGALRHASFEASSRVLHHWGQAGASMTALLDTGTQATVLAARLGKAFHELSEEDA